LEQGACVRGVRDWRLEPGESFPRDRRRIDERDGSVPSRKVLYGDGAGLFDASKLKGNVFETPMIVVVTYPATLVLTVAEHAGTSHTV